MHLTASETCDEIGVDSADDNLATDHALPCRGFVIGDPPQLRAGEVGVEPQAGQLGDSWLQALLLQLLADACGAPVLPDDCAAWRCE